MDRGQLFSDRFEIIPVDNGSYVIRRSGYDHIHPDNHLGQRSMMIGFSKITDLMAFLNDEHEAMKSQGPQPGNL